MLLEELHQWYVNNLKGTEPKRRATPSSQVRTPEIISQSQPLDTAPDFELTMKTTTGGEIICPCASFRREWLEAFSNDVLNPNSESMFICKCLDRHMGTMSHQPHVQRYGCKCCLYVRRKVTDGLQYLTLSFPFALQVMMDRGFYTKRQTTQRIN